MEFGSVLDRLLTLVKVTDQVRDAYLDEITDLQFAIEEVLFALKRTFEDGPGYGVTESLQMALARLNHAQSLHDAVKEDAVRHYQVLESLQSLLWRTAARSTFGSPIRSPQPQAQCP
jgi:uncharacterized membrane protein YccC